MNFVSYKRAYICKVEGQKQTQDKIRYWIIEKSICPSLYK